ncbi:MAG: hypothetical protein ABIS01_12840 [Ferruginibacter sp.]
MHDSFHIPGRPKTSEPPGIAGLAASLHHPGISKVAVTTTPTGSWALLVVVNKGVQVPIKEIEEKCINYPIIYQQDTDRSTFARPAYPGLGE